MTSRRTILLACAASVALGLSASHARPADRIPFEDLRTFAEVLDQVRTSYVEPVDEHVLLENATRGMLSQLDPASVYLDVRAFAQLQEITSGQFAGIGLELGFDHGRIAVVAPIDDSPAARAGIQPGDIVTSLDGVAIKNLTLSEALERMRGAAGTTLELSVAREGKAAARYTLTREIINVVSVRGDIPERDYLYLRIAQFQVNTGRDLAAVFGRLRARSGGRVRGVVLDLRNNPGGVVQSAVEVADAFLDGGLIVATRGRSTTATQSFSAARGDIALGAPLVVLMNDGSASAAEIVAGALQDQKRAVIVGTRSYGKGSVQTVLPLSGNRGLKLTTALYYTPSGKSIQGRGIDPDINIAAAFINRPDASVPPPAAQLTTGNPAEPTGPYQGPDQVLAAGLSALRKANGAATAPR